VTTEELYELHTKLKMALALENGSGHFPALAWPAGLFVRTSCALTQQRDAGHGREVEVDAQGAVRIHEEKALDLRLRAGRIGEEVVAQRDGRLAGQDDAVVLETDRSPALDGKAIVLLSGVVGRHEERQGSLEVGSELLLRGQRRLEEHRRHAASVQSLDVVGSHLLKVLAVRARGGDGNDTVTSGLLGSKHLPSRHLTSVGHGRVMEVDTQVAVRINEVA